MAIRKIKTGFSLACVAALMIGCASQQEEAAPETTTQQPVVEQQVTEELGTVFYFDYDKSVLKSEARATLMAHAERLKEEGNNVRLEGHADERGTREYNMALGERRANAVRDFLILQGVNASQLETISYGEEQAVAYCHDESCWSQNRRVEMR